MSESRLLSPALPRGAPHGPGRRICTKPCLYALSSRALPLDEGLCGDARRGHRQAQTQHNCCHTNRTRRFCTKISVVPYCASMMQYLNFSKGYKVFERLERALVLLLLWRGWYSDERSFSGERHADTRDVCRCSAAMRMSHATRSDASTLYVPDLGRDRGGHGPFASS